jgi:NhaP-type Na+/H+ or K+/H+ antiporter
MCFVPATFEIAATRIFAPIFFDMSLLEAAMLGAVLAAVSPAVVVPKMIKLVETGYGKASGIPQLLMAGSSADDIYAVVLFASFMGMYSGNTFNAADLLKIPFTIISGLLIGIISGFVLVRIFNKIDIRSTVKVLIILGVCFMLAELEAILTDILPMSSLLASIALSGTILKLNSPLAKKLSVKFSKVWIPTEVMLFVLFGATVDLNYVANAGVTAVSLILIILLIRVCGVFICLIKSNLNIKERVFCAIAYLPKATVQAAIGGIPLTAGVAAGNTIMTVAVLAILITAPLGAIGIDATYKKLLKRK